jgi:hypothetical protein
MEREIIVIMALVIATNVLVILRASKNVWTKMVAGRNIWNTNRGSKEMDEVVVDGVTYIRVYSKYPFDHSFGDPSGFWDNFSENEREEIKRRLIAELIGAGYFERKDQYEKKNSIYKKDELFYGL